MTGRPRSSALPSSRGRPRHTTSRCTGPVVAGIAALVALAGPAAGERGADPPSLPNGFVDARTLAPDIRLDLRYLGHDNFVGRPIAGYEGERLILTEPAARALAKVQATLRASGLGLLVYDAYRPTRAVADFVAWARDLSDQKQKARFYPDVAKSELFAEGYIAERSSHSRGSTVDLTIVPLEPRDAAPLDMGTPFDFFSPDSWPLSLAVAAPARAHRLLLREVMEQHGFAPYDKEWWHFTLRDEPFPDRSFDFPVR